MDIQQLKLYAERVRAALARARCDIKHGQALDLMAALPGLRNWPEVMAFPERVTRATLDEAAFARLVRRIQTKCRVEFTPQDLERVFAKGEEGVAVVQLDVWRTGPAPGIYVTTSPQALANLIARYTDEVPGVAFFAEEAGRDAESAIELGEQGIYSKGLSLAPRGSLLVVGPLQLSEASWDECVGRVIAASNLVDERSMRVAVLVDTCSPATLHQDMASMLLMEGDDGEFVDPTLQGVVVEDGRCECVAPFVAQYQRATAPLTWTAAAPLPKPLADTLAAALAFRRTGIFVAAHDPFLEPIHGLMDSMLAVLAPLGPVTIIQTSSHHSFPHDKESAGRFGSLPVCPSIDVALAQGYRCLVVDAPSGLEKAMVRHAKDACFLIHSHSGDVRGALLHGLGMGGYRHAENLEAITAILGVIGLESSSGRQVLCDAYHANGTAIHAERMADLWEEVTARRAVRWEDQLSELLEAGTLTSRDIQKSLRLWGLDEFLRTWRRNAARAVAT